MERARAIEELTSRIAAVRRPHPTRVAVDGVDAAGKTTLCDELVAPLEALGRHVVRASVDGFHHPSAIRHRRGPDSPEGYYGDAFDYASLKNVLLRPLGDSGSLRFQRAIFDYRTDTHVDSPIETAQRDSVLLFDGVFLLRPELKEYWDLSIFVQADFATTVARAETRDLSLFGSKAAVLSRYQKRYIPAQRLYLAECTPEKTASIVLDNNDPQQPSVSLNQ